MSKTISHKIQLKGASASAFGAELANSSHILKTDALKTTAADRAITRVFSSGDISLFQQIQPSTCTYNGMLESLQSIKDNAELAGISNVCVLCPRYYAHTGGVVYSDTQAGGGGKCCIKDGKRECPEVAASAEIAEELRLCAKHLTSISRKRAGKKVTEVFAARVSECSPIKNFDPKVYGAKERRGVDDYMSRVAFIPWGTLDECLGVLTAMEVSTNPTVLVDSIDAISIVSIETAIKMVEFAHAEKAKKKDQRVTIRARVKFWDSTRGFGYATPEDSSQTKGGADVRLNAQSVEEARLEAELLEGDVLELTINPGHDRPMVLAGGLKMVQAAPKKICKQQPRAATSPHWPKVQLVNSTVAAAAASTLNSSLFADNLESQMQHMFNGSKKVSASLPSLLLCGKSELHVQRVLNHDLADKDRPVSSATHQRLGEIIRQRVGDVSFELWVEFFRSNGDIHVKATVQWQR